MVLLKTFNKNMENSFDRQILGKGVGSQAMRGSSGKRRELKLDYITQDSEKKHLYKNNMFIIYAVSLFYGYPT